MTDLEPFLDSCDDFERGLLRSVRNDAPAADAASKTIAALGLHPSTMAATAATRAAAGALGARAGSALTVLKGLGVGLLVGTVVMGVAGSLSQTSAGDPHPAAPARDGHALNVGSGAARSMAAEQPRADSVIAEPTALGSASKPSSGARPSVLRDAAPGAETSRPQIDQAIAPLTSSPALAAFGPLPSTGRTPEPPNAVSIAEQVKIIDQARSALQRGRASDALSLARVYAQRWPNGALTIEAAIVRIEAELALHDRSAAERDARAVISARPGARYLTRVRELFSPPLVE